MIIKVASAGTVLWLYLIAGGFGLLGGLGGELLKEEKGRFEVPRIVRSRVKRLKKGAEKQKDKHRFWDLGGVATMVVGAIAAMAAIWVFPPEETVTVITNGSPVSTAHYNLGTVISLSLIIGSAGAAFMATFQARALAAATKNTADEGLDNVAAKIKDPGATTDQRLAEVDKVKKAIRSIGTSGIGNPNLADF